MSAIDPNINQRVAADPKESVWVAASAGTGKTKVLSDRVLNLLLKGCPPEKILCITFTKAAAAQMENRIEARLANWIGLNDADLKKELANITSAEPGKELLARARQLFAKVLEAKGGMKILTIHSFCQSVLKRFPLEAGVSPSFEVMDEGAATELMDKVIAESIHSKTLKEELKILSLYLEEGDLIADLKNFDGNRAKFIDVLQKYGSLEGFIASLYERYGIDFVDTEENLIREICQIPDDIKQILNDMLADKRKLINKVGENLSSFMLLSDDEKYQKYGDYELVFLTKNKTIRANNFYQDGPANFEANRLFELEEKRKAVVAMRAMAAFLRVADAVLQEYKSRKILKGLLDYADLILKTKELLDKSGAAMWVLYKLDGGLEHILVDEAQDTSAEQWDIIRTLSDEFFAGESASPFVRTIFAVGDKKQSIFSFQGADPKKFALNKEYFEKQLERVGKKLKTVPLTVSFRSTKPVIELVNRLLENPTIKDAVLDKGEEAKHVAYREGVAGRVEVWPLEPAEDSDEPAPWQPPIDRVKTKQAQDRLATKLADKISDMIQNDFLPSRGRRVQPQDIMILLRKRGPFFEKLVRELKAKQIPVTGVDKMKITEQMAVMDLMALGDFLLLPEDDLNLAGLLKSPLFGFDEAELYDVCYERGTVSLWDNLKRKAKENKVCSKYAQTVETLDYLLSIVDKVPPSHLFDYVLSAMGGRKKIIERLGFDALDAMFEFVSLALEFEEMNTYSLQGFLAWLKARDVESKRDLEQGDVGAVRITTVHSSKGLEAPIIFLPDTKTAMGSNKERLYWITDKSKLEIPLWFVAKSILPAVMLEDLGLAKQAGENESKRLLYVAVTRPQDKLYVAGWNRKTKNKNTDEHDTDENRDVSATKSTWYDLIKSAFKENEVVQYGKDKIYYLESEQTSEPKPDKKQIGEQGYQVPKWLNEQAEKESLPLKPLAPSEFGEEREVVADSPLFECDMVALEWGRIIHKLLQILPDVAKDLRMDMMQKYLKLNLPDLDELEQEKLINSVAKILADERFKKFFGVGSKAEVPVIGMLDDKVFSGRVDRLWVGEKEVVVIDYKTNRNVPDGYDKVPKLYKQQMSVYKQLLQKLFKDKVVRAYILWTQNLSFMEM